MTPEPPKTPEELTFDDYVKIGIIYSGLPEAGVRERAQETQREYHFKTLELGLGKYLRGLGVALKSDGVHFYSQEILQLGRKISPLELEALRLRDKVKASGQSGIEIYIEGLE